MDDRDAIDRSIHACSSDHEFTSKGPMGISFRCPACGKAFSVGDDLAGKKAKCMLCGGMMVVPARAPDEARASASPPHLYDFRG